MSFFKKLTANKEVRAALGVLDEIACTRVSLTGIGFPIADTWHDSVAFQIVRKEIEKGILAHPDELVHIIQNGTSPRQLVWDAVANIAGNHLASGDYHMRRGFLKPLGPGEYLLRLFDTAIDELISMGAIEADCAKEQKATLRKDIKNVG